MGLIKVELNYDCKNAEANSLEELIQKSAWRLVRSAEDRMTGPKRGTERLIWCVNKLRVEFPNIPSDLEDYIRSAYMNFKLESK